MIHFVCRTAAVCSAGAAPVTRLRSSTVLAVLILSASPVLAATHAVSSATALAALLGNANTLKPGDTIQLTAGTFRGKFIATVSGSKGKPITLKGTSTTILTNPGGYGFHLKASYWKLTGFTVEKSKKGVILDGAQHNLLDQLTVRNIDEEGIHLRSHSSDNVVQSSKISATGLGAGMAPYGEGIYIGSAISNWPDYTAGLPDRSNRNCIAYNTLGPNISAEGIDIKEGTSGGKIIGNSYDRPSLSKAAMDFNGADSFLDVKGDGYMVYGNVVANTLKNIYLVSGIQVHQKIEAGVAYGNNNVFRKNTMSLGGTASYGFDIQSSTWGNTVCSDNAPITGATKGVSNLGPVACTALTAAPTCPAVLNQ